MTRLWLDTETYSEVNLKSKGLQAYLRHVELMVVSWAFDTDTPDVRDLTAGQTIPEAVERALRDPSVELWAHKSDFDRNVLGQRYPEVLDVNRWRCTLAQANSHSLPGALGTLSEIFKLGESGKKSNGKELVQLFCKPNKDGTRNTRLTHPEQWAEFLEYAKQDIPAMRTASDLMPTWNFPDNLDELELWRRDQRMNLRGVLIDVDFARAAVEAIKLEKARNAKATHEATKGAVDRATQRDRLLEHILDEYDVRLPDMRAATLERRLEDEDLPDAVRLLIRLRLEASLTSVAKYARALEVLADDGERLKFLIQFCGALRTGRAAGRTVQPQNLARPQHTLEEIDLAIAATKAGCLDMVVPDVLPTLSSCVRGLFIAPKGRKLVVVDLAQIEGRKITWLAGEEWKLEAYRAYDAGTGPDTYKGAYSRSFGIPVEAVTKDQRQLGKVQELALNYQGAVGAFSAMAAALGMESLATDAEVADAMANPDALRDTPLWPLNKQDEPLEYAAEYDFRRTIHEAKVLRIVKAWRKAHPKIVSYWYTLERCAKHTTITGEPTTVGEGAAAVHFDQVGTWLRCRLPSGRFLSYPAARVVDDKLSYMGINPYSRQWQRIRTYGGKLAENITQASSRDVIMRRIPDAEAAGYAVVLHAHDELITEAPDAPEYNETNLAQIIAAPQAWLPGLPLAAAGFESYRYRKG